MGFDLDSIPGWFSFRENYDELIETLPGGLIVETGAFLGKSICYLGRRIKETGKPFHAVTVELGTGSGLELGVDYHGQAVADGNGTLVGQLHRNILAAGVQDVVTVIVADSVRAASLFADNSIDCVFLDSAHTKDHVVAEIRAWVSRIKPGGWLSGHDYTTHWIGVVEAVKQELPEHEAWGVDSWRWKKPVT